jgi:hypothetical protein
MTSSPDDTEIERILTGYGKHVKNAQGLYSYATEKKLSKKQAHAAIQAMVARGCPQHSVPPKAQGHEAGNLSETA